MRFFEVERDKNFGVYREAIRKLKIKRQKYRVKMKKDCVTTYEEHEGKEDGFGDFGLYWEVVSGNNVGMIKATDL